MPSRRPHPHCTPFAPHEQLLVSAVGVAMLVVVVAMVVPRRFALSLLRSRTPYTPREQSLTAVVGVLVVVSVKGLAWGVVCCLVVAPPPSSPHLVIVSVRPRLARLVPPLPASSPLCVSSPSPPHPHRPYSTRNPPHEQLLVRLGGGWCAVVM